MNKKKISKEFLRANVFDNILPRFISSIGLHNQRCLMVLDFVPNKMHSATIEADCNVTNYQALLPNIILTV